MNNKPEKMIGILAGMGPRATAPFINAVIDECQAQYGAKDDIDFPEMMILSLPTPFHVDRPIDHDEMQRVIIAGLQKLERAGVSFIAMPCNSAHIYFDALRSSVRVPLLNMIDETLAHFPEGANATLLATRPAFDSGVYQAGIASRQGQLIFDPAWQQQVDRAIAAIKRGELMDARDEWCRLMVDVEARSVEAIVCACTDLNVVADAQPIAIPFIDSSKALAKAVVREYLRST
jgi:aspartate racemase